MNRSPAQPAQSAYGFAYGSARHPFRATLPLHVLRELPRHEPEVAAAIRRAEERLKSIEVRSDPVDLKRITARDLREFLLAYCACFFAVMMFIA
ncbi:hypothetical protein Saro_1333 [Novosphingobium aromaticivorans DSM 12444]|uniref:Uncharacterized protein n=1 Tax=Novosphingobium aromaticivorans (strain ATCC 700278 / DSM 12444 / CCUG 56034 / CIP 105152 / NBRC 16084 / F199) TaxID=279238 RepID=Q2G8P6_NOVAD|nr:hypothetical protein [Novosphingobium aromaticivorans]ABD25777.1 hypothetical protein Saro_1333 [Novosphingobium aromaticivorans DSM 12444]SCY03473.1 hypothetical protein SAMN05660666_00676 [Novosphingobium aromaticivorans]